jgi:Fe-S-cluster containining protein
MITEEECKKCGLCCWFDSETIAGNKEALINPDGFCLNYEKGLGCKIYEKRPQACRDYERGGKLCLERRKNIKYLYKNKIIKWQKLI